MKLSIVSSICLFALTTTAFASKPLLIEPTPVTAPGKLYVGIFGGGGSSDKFNASQFGTAFYTEEAGGPLAVNGFGDLDSESASFFGIQLGYKAPDLLISPSTRWTLGPAVELEGFSMSNSTFNGDLINNTTRLPEHDFNVSYPMSRNVYLANLVVNFDNPCYLIHPYIGFGIGSALIRITDADSTQISPPEAGVNHYNASTSANDTTFAGQIKLGLSYDINSYLSLFADYRWLYIGSTSYVFGSTVYSVPSHVATSSWQVNMDSQRYNLGDIGIRVNLA